MGRCQPGSAVVVLHRARAVSRGGHGHDDGRARSRVTAHSATPTAAATELSPTWLPSARRYLSSVNNRPNADASPAQLRITSPGRHQELGRSSGQYDEPASSSKDEPHGHCIREPSAHVPLPPRIALSAPGRRDIRHKPGNRRLEPSPRSPPSLAHL